MQQIRKEKQQNYAFQFLTINTGKGMKGSLKRLIEEKENREVKYYLDRDTIEMKFMEFNIQYYQKAHNTIAY